MHLDVYLIRGRGERGDRFQLAMVQDGQGNYFKGEYDQTRHYSSLDELKESLAAMVKVKSAELTITEMVL